MSARPQDVWYPPQAETTQDKDEQPVCTHCNVNDPHDNGVGCCTSRSSSNGETDYAPCAVWCNSSCNTVCDSVQAYCSKGRQLITSHGTVGAYPPPACMAKDQFIFRNWTAEYWNGLIDQLDTAEQMGETKPQGTGPVATPAAPDPCNDTHIPNSLVTAEKYNQVVAKLNRFNLNIATVNVGDVIRGAHAVALHEGHASATFNTDVCDVCNVSGQTSPKCDCWCGCACSCPCGCDCPCSCDCSCSCSCDCSCSCSRG